MSLGPKQKIKAKITEKIKAKITTKNNKKTKVAKKIISSFARFWSIFGLSLL